jgi:hypothetical protein
MLDGANRRARANAQALLVSRQILGTAELVPAREQYLQLLALEPEFQDVIQKIFSATQYPEIRERFRGISLPFTLDILRLI